jgi:formamidopyrimidine-DNA glycosylase
VNANATEPEHVSLLDARGAGCLLVQAMRDPASTVCSDCHGVIAQKRWESHRAFWCPALLPSDEEDAT